MISWRYHLVSIVAVILAVALGVLAGATVVGDRFVRQLRAQTDAAQRRADEAEAEAGRLRTFMNSAIPYLTADTLVGESVVLVTQDPWDRAMRDQVLQSLEAAGADVVAQLTATAQLTNADAEADLADLVGRPSVAPADLPAALAGQVADRLTIGPSSRGDGTDLLERLGPFVQVDPGQGIDLAEVGGTGTMVVVFAGGTGDPVLDPDAFLLPLTGELAKTPGLVMAAGEGLTSDFGFVSAVRDDGDAFPDGTIVTVDDLDQPFGRVALVLGLADLLASPEGGGDYGVNGSGGILPPPRSSETSA